MKKIIAALVLSCSLLPAQDGFVRGIMMYGDDRANFAQLSDSLHLSWVQALVDEPDGTKDLNVLNNTQGLSVIGISHQGVNIYETSRAQRMVFEAERETTPPGSEGLWNYFALRPNSSPDPFDATVVISSGSAGYMVQSAMPDNEYRYERTHYIASFILKRTPAPSGNPAVVGLQVWCKVHNAKIAERILYNNDFATSNLETKALEFHLSPPTPSAVPSGVLLGGGERAEASGGCLVDDEYSIDIRVYWYGNVTTWLDKVIIEDDLGQELFAGVHNSGIQTSAQDFKNNYPLMKRFYMVDEPFVSVFLAYNYVQNQIGPVYGADTASGKGSAITAADKHWGRFLIDAQPRELLVDPYPITADIPTTGMSDAQAVDVGIAPFNNDPVAYTEKLQNALQGRYIGTLGKVSSLAKQNQMKLWIIPQLHGEYFEDVGRFELPSDPNKLRLRPPSGNEIKTMCNLAVAYGAKGIFPFELTTASGDWDGLAWFDGLVNRDLIDGAFQNHWGDYITYPSPTGSKQVKVNYREKWDAVAEVMGKYEQLSSVLSSLAWQGTKSWNNGATAGSWTGKISNATTNVGGEMVYVETGHFTSGGFDYLFVVNKRTLSSDARDITMTLSSAASQEVINVESGEIFIVAPSGSLTEQFSPGEGKLYRLGPAIWSGSKTVNQTVTIPAGATLIVTPGTNLNMANGNQIQAYGTLTLGDGGANPITLSGNETFRAKPGGEVTVASNTVVNNLRNITVDTDGILTVNNNAQLKFTSATNVYYEGAPKGSIGVYGRINADGATFTTNSSDPNYYWAGMYILNSAPTESNAIRNCVVERCKQIVISNSQNLGFGYEIVGNTFRNCLNPIRLTYGTVIQDIRDNIFEDNLEDGIVVFSSIVYFIDNNTFRKNAGTYSGRDGILFYGANNQPLVTNNTISYGSRDGIRCQNYAAPNLGGPDQQTSAPGNNTIANNAAYGVNALSTTLPFLGDYDYANQCAKYGGDNDIYGNSIKQLAVTNLMTKAEWNYWGVDPDSPNDEWSFQTTTFQSLFGGSPQVRPAQNGQGTEGAAASFGNVMMQAATAEPVFAEEEEFPREKKLLELGDQLVYSRRYESAISVYDSLISEYPSTVEAETALLKIHYAMMSFNKLEEKAGRTETQRDAKAYFVGVHSTNSGNRLERGSLELKAINAALSGDIEGAINANTEIINRWPGTESEKHALAALFDLYIRQQNHENASKALAALENEFPDDDVTRIVRDILTMATMFDNLAGQSQGTSTRTDLALGKPEEQKQSSRGPEETGLLHSYPNPFNPTTTITYKLVAPSLVKITVYDLLGRQVVELVNGYQSQGNKSVTFDGSRVPSGMYHVSMVVDGKMFVRRMLLVK